jgi:hypothetical protein
VADFWQQMQTLKDRTGLIAAGALVPCHRRLSRVENTVRIALVPNPQIKALNQTSEQISSGISGVQRTFRVLGLSKSYSRSYLENQTVDFLIDEILRCELLEIKDEGLSWTLTLGEKLGQQKFPLNNYQ